MKRLLALAAVTALLLSAAWGQTPGAGSRPASAPAETGPQARALLISGSGGSEAYSRNLLDWSNRFCGLLVNQCGVRPQNILVLTEKADPNANPPRQEATLENVRLAMEKIKGLLRRQDQLIVYMAGQGQINEPVGKLSLPGPDLKADEFGNWLDSLPTNKIVFVNCASGGAEFVKTCLQPGGVLITGAGVDTDGNQAYFAEFLLQGYETRRADANKDGVIDLLEAYAYGARETTNFYHRQYLLSGNRQNAKPDDPLLWDVRGKETRATWRKLYAGTKNELGPPPQQPGVTTRPDPETEADSEPELGDYGPQWHNRRVLAEHARLDDTEGKKTFMLWRPYEFDPLPQDQPGQVGYVARRTALGRPEPLKVVSTAPATGATTKQAPTTGPAPK